MSLLLYSDVCSRISHVTFCLLSFISNNTVFKRIHLIIIASENVLVNLVQLVKYASITIYPSKNVSQFPCIKHFTSSLELSSSRGSKTSKLFYLDTSFLLSMPHHTFSHFDPFLHYSKLELPVPFPSLILCLHFSSLSEDALKYI